MPRRRGKHRLTSVAVDVPEADPQFLDALLVEAKRQITIPAIVADVFLQYNVGQAILIHPSRRAGGTAKIEPTKPVVTANRVAFSEPKSKCEVRGVYAFTPFSRGYKRYLYVYVTPSSLLQVAQATQRLEFFEKSILLWARFASPDMVEKADKSWRRFYKLKALADRAGTESEGLSAKSLAIREARKLTEMAQLTREETL